MNELPGDEGLRTSLHTPWDVPIVLNMRTHEKFLSEGSREDLWVVNIFTDHEVIHDPTLGNIFKHVPCTYSLELLHGTIHGPCNI